jgi:hypothetical protein
MPAYRIVEFLGVPWMVASESYYEYALVVEEWSTSWYSCLVAENVI